MTRRRELLATLAGGAALAGCVGFAPPSTPSSPTSPTSPTLPTLPTSPTSPSSPTPAPLPSPDQPPPLPREFRAAWVATVAHIDWPSKPGLPADAQRAEALAILDRAALLNLNALILQVRPAADALYASTLEPWSELLSGEQGKAPQPWYDPLAFWVREAHRRGLELHAWFNPFRARHSSARTGPVAPHRAVTHAAQVKRYGDQLWMDPGEPEAAAHSLAVIADVLRRYDIDGVHIDDYFYPYPVKAGEADLPFPDHDSYARYRLAGGALARDDWRRANVDRFVQQLYATVRATKPWVRVGISPFGIGRPERRPAGITGFSQYDKLYADVETWLAQGWLDYLAPQLYWPVQREGQPFAPLLDQWVAENTQQRHLWPGLFTSMVTRGEPLGARSWPAREIAEQIALQRQRGDKAGGHIHFSMAALMQGAQDRDGLFALLQGGAYATPALVPATPWLPGQALAAPTLRRDGARVRIEPGAGDAASRWALWRRQGTTWRFAVLPAHERALAPQGADLVVLSAIDRVGNAGPPQLLKLA